MSRATVRAAVAAWISPPNVAGLNTVYRAQPKLAPGQDYGLADGGGSGAQAFVHIEHETETRTAVGGAHGGEKRVDYQVGIVILFRSVKQDTLAATDDYDALIEALKTRLRADRTLGTAGTANPIFQAGEGANGIEITSDLPRDDHGSTLIWSALRLAVTEIELT